MITRSACEMGKALYDGGWRSNDREQLKDEYGFTDSFVDAIIVVLQQIEMRCEQ